MQAVSGSSLFTFDGLEASKAVTFSGFTIGRDFISFHDFSDNPIAGFAWASHSEMLTLTDGTHIAVNFATH